MRNTRAPADHAAAAGRKAQRAARTRTSRSKPSEPALLGDPDQRAPLTAALATPQVTGIPQPDWDLLAARLEPAYHELRQDLAKQARGGRPSAYPRRSQRALKVDIKALMLAVVFHTRYRLPTAQIRRLIDLNPVGLKNHIDHLVPLFGQFGHQLTPHGDTIRKIEHLLTEALPQPTAATRDVTT